MPIVHDWLARRASLAPERTALIDSLRGERRISWREWNASANRTARFLRESLGVRLVHAVVENGEPCFDGGFTA